MLPKDLAEALPSGRDRSPASLVGWQPSPAGTSGRKEHLRHRGAREMVCQDTRDGHWRRYTEPRRTRTVRTAFAVKRKLDRDLRPISAH